MDCKVRKRIHLAEKAAAILVPAPWKRISKIIYPHPPIHKPQE
jgi:hypothetical protein